MRANGWASSAGASLPGCRQDINLFFRHQHKSARYVQSNAVNTDSENVIKSVSINALYLVG